MARVKQYPHYLFAEVTESSVQDEQGNWTEAKVSRKFLSMCREEADGRGSEFQVAGGEYHKATSLIQCPKSCPEVTKGTKVVIANDRECSSIRIEGVCLNFDPAQLHCRLWL
jgi:hypothetical protein